MVDVEWHPSCLFKNDFNRKWDAARRRDGKRHAEDPLRPYMILFYSTLLCCEYKACQPPFR